MPESTWRKHKFEGIGKKIVQEHNHSESNMKIKELKKKSDNGSQIEAKNLQKRNRRSGNC